MKKTDIFITAVVIIILLPIFIAAFYNHPSADDFSYSVFTKRAIENGGNIIDIVKAAWRNNIGYYNSWQGLYVSGFILALQPAIFGEHFYALTTFIVTGCIFIGILILAKTIYKYVLKSESKRYWIVSLVTLFFVLEKMPSPAEGLYWFNGSMNYLFFLMILFIQIAELIKYCSEHKIRNLLSATVLAFLLSGGNHVTAFAGILVSIICFIFTIYKKQDRLSFIPIITGTIGFILNLTAPGTAVRAASINYKGNAIVTITHTAMAVLDRVDTWFTFSTLLFLGIICILMYEEIKKKNISLKISAILSILSYIVLAGMMCVPYQAAGNYGAGRLENTLFITFIVMITVITVSLFSNLIKYIKMPKNPEKIYIYAFGILFITLAGINYPTSKEVNYTTSVKLVKEFKNGIITGYNDEMNERIKLYLDEENKNVEVKPLVNRSEVISSGEISSDPTYWCNQAISNYYKKETVSLEKEKEEDKIEEIEELDENKQESEK